MRILLVLLTVVAAAPAAAQTFDPALAATTWRVIEVAGAPMPNPVTLQFGTHSISGRAPCNRYTAGFKQTGQAIDIGQPVPTRSFCQGRMETEKQYFDALHAARTYTLGEGTLSLNAADGSALIKLAK